MLNVIFPAHPLDTRAPDPDFAAEHDAALEAGFSISLLNLEALLEDRALAAISAIEASDSAMRFLYRGWMISTQQYRELVQALLCRGYHPLTTPDEYRLHHEYPGAWSRMPDLMPRSVVVELNDARDIGEAVRTAAEQLRGPVLIKDYVKSRKHEWFDACYIPDIGDHVAALRVVENFVRRQGDALQGGLVFRQALELASLGNHPKSQIPIPVEYRTFFLGGKPLLTERYWDECEYDNAPIPPESLLQSIADQMGSGFYTADTVLSKDGTWYVIETGDGQVSQIPDRLPAKKVFQEVAARIRS